MTTWRLLHEGRCPARKTMEKDLDLFEAVRQGSTQGALRFYNWAETALTIGYHQRPFSFNDPHLDIPVIRRPTGGGAVLHSDDIAFSISTAATGKFAAGIPECYGILSQVFRTAFHGCGIGAEIKGGSHAFSPLCFSRPSPAELILGRNKIMGMALARKGRFLLVQGVIPLHVDHELSERVFGEIPRHGSQGLLDVFPDFSEKLFFNRLHDGFISQLGVLLCQGDQDDHKHHCADEREIEPGCEEVCEHHVTEQGEQGYARYDA
ncbi:MAG TPA: hypothetical protein VMU10_12475 [Desulfomonilia bacterium]|nr:hypothetical protein [Desulfomonilia bacterium]